MLSVSQLLVRGYTRAQVVEELNRDGSRPKPATPHRVAVVIQRLRENHRLVAARSWQSQLDETLADLELELRKLDAVEEEAWAAFRRSGLPRREARSVEITVPTLDPREPDGPPVLRVSRQTRHSASREAVSDPRFLLVILETVRRRAELRQQSLELRGWRDPLPGGVASPAGVDVEALLRGDRVEMRRVLGFELLRLYEAEERAARWAVTQADPAERVRYERLASEAQGRRIRMLSSAGVEVGSGDPLAPGAAAGPLEIEVIETPLDANAAEWA